MWASCPTACPATPALDDAAARTRLEQAVGLRRCPRQPGKSYKQMLNAAGG
jgi:hypothetical protein